MMEGKLMYNSLSSLVNPSFWHKLTELKLDVDKLDESPRKIWGSCTNFQITNTRQAYVEVDSTSFNSEFTAANTHFAFHGLLINKNTIEAFKSCDKTDIINQSGKMIWEDIISGACVKNPSLLNRFLVLSFADLKKYNYYYWFAIVSFCNIKMHLQKIEPFLSNWVDSYNALPKDQKSHFILNLNENKIVTLNEYFSKCTNHDLDNVLYGYADKLNTNSAAGGSIRNYAVFIAYKCPSLQGKPVKFLSYVLCRADTGFITNEKSKVFTVILPKLSETIATDGFIGWEKNERGNLGPRMVNMKESVDPKSLAETSVDLNLKLMKWRVLPAIDLDKIKQLKCLILGSGTLGCAVGRNLLAWGVRHITFMDNSNVSHSNPVRQSLFTFEDAVKAKPKARAAADALKSIFPGVRASGEVLNIPMPDHPVGESMLNSTVQSIAQLTGVIKSHDVIFLLMDSRESRWLPTLLATYHKKTAINAALGFDTYLVMRHGLRDVSTHIESTASEPKEGKMKINGSDLGCYFCNDITAPGNSMKDRTLDQQCTVTRPGVSNIAAALAVELAIALSQHPSGGYAPAYYSASGNMESSLFDVSDESILGLLPHTMRGSLSNYALILPASQRYNKCIACSESVLERYEKEGNDFLLNVFNSSKCLEDVTGLSVINNVEEIDLNWDMSDEESS